MNTSRIPEFTDESFDGVLTWFAEMSQRDLLFHPDEDPESIIEEGPGLERVFSDGECAVLRQILDRMFEVHGDRVYDAAYPIFMNCVGIMLDA